MIIMSSTLFGFACEFMWGWQMEIESAENEHKFPATRPIINYFVSLSH